MRLWVFGLEKTLERARGLEQSPLDSGDSGDSAAILTKGSGVATAILQRDSEVAAAILRQSSEVAAAILRRSSGMAAILGRDTGLVAILGRDFGLAAILVLRSVTRGKTGGSGVVIMVTGVYEGGGGVFINLTDCEGRTTQLQHIISIL